MKPFDYIFTRSEEEICSLIKDENPQAIALILSYCEKKKIKQNILKLLDDSGKISERMKHLRKQDIQPDIPREIERVLERKISENRQIFPTIEEEYTDFTDLVLLSDQEIRKIFYWDSIFWPSRLGKAIFLIDPIVSYKIRANFPEVEPISCTLNEANMARNELLEKVKKKLKKLRKELDGT